MGDVTLNSAVRSNLRTMQSTQELMNRTGDRLSTGKKVNSALDNPSSFFTAQALDRRAGDLSGLLDSVSSSVKTLEAADNGLKAINEVVESLKATARSALQSPSAVETKASVESASVLGLTEDNLLGVDTVPVTVTGDVTGLTSATTMASLGYGNSALEFGIRIWDGQKLEFGSGPGLTSVPTTLGDLISAINAADLGLSATLTGDGRFEVTADDPGSTILIYGRTAAAPNLGVETVLYPPHGGPQNGETLAFTDRSGVQKTLTFSANGVNTLDELNQWLEDNDVALEASVDSDGANGKIKLQTTNDAAASTPTISGSLTTGGAAFDGRSFSAPTLAKDAAEKRGNFAKDYNAALKQIATLARDSSFNGVNLLQGDDLDITFNEDGSSRLDVKGVEFDATGLGLEDIAEADFYDADSVNKVIDKIEAAFDKIEAQSSKFGSQLQIVQTRQSFTKDMVGTLEDGALALIGADTNEEAANLATLQTRQSLIVSSLSISTQQESNVLQLLR